MQALEERVGRPLLAQFAAEVLDRWRAEVSAGALEAAALQARLSDQALAAELEQRVREEQGRGVVRAINATGVVLHPGLGRSPVHPAAAEAMGRAAAG